jgi:thiamine-monophosphate kinase
VPISNGALDYSRAAKVDPVDLALYGGEEFELVVSVKKNAVKRALSAVKSLRVIGRVTHDEGTVILLRDGKRTLVEPRGWEHLTSNTLSP